MMTLQAATTGPASGPRPASSDGTPILLFLFSFPLSLFLSTSLPFSLPPFPLSLLPPIPSSILSPPFPSFSFFLLPPSLLFLLPALLIIGILHLSLSFFPIFLPFPLSSILSPSPSYVTCLICFLLPSCSSLFVPHFFLLTPLFPYPSSSFSFSFLFPFFFESSLSLPIPRSFLPPA